jgi:hypothetical protein
VRRRPFRPPSWFPGLLLKILCDPRGRKWSRRPGSHEGTDASGPPEVGFHSIGKFWNLNDTAFMKSTLSSLVLRKLACGLAVLPLLPLLLLAGCDQRKARIDAERDAVVEGDGTGPDIWRASVRVFDAAVAKAYGGKRKIAWLEVSPARRPSRTTGCPTRRSRRSASTSSDQGPADHAGRRRHPLAQRRAAPGTRPLRLPAPGALLQGRALAR